MQVYRVHKLELEYFRGYLWNNLYSFCSNKFIIASSICMKIPFEYIKKKTARVMKQDTQCLAHYTLFITLTVTKTVFCRKQLSLRVRQKHDYTLFVFIDNFLQKLISSFYPYVLRKISFVLVQKPLCWVKHYIEGTIKNLFVKHCKYTTHTICVSH